MTYKKVFHPKHGQKLIRTPTFLHFSDKQRQFTQNFAQQPYIFFAPKVLRIIFTPKITPPKPKNSKLDKNPIFLGHPVEHSRTLQNITPPPPPANCKC